MPENYGPSANLLLTFEVDPDPKQGITAKDLEKNLAACGLTGNNKVGRFPEGLRLLGKVIKVSEELQAGTPYPALCTVQVTGVVRFKYANPVPKVGDAVSLAGDGYACQAIGSPDVEWGGTKHRGMVLAVNTSDFTCDVLLDG